MKDEITKELKQLIILELKTVNGKDFITVDHDRVAELILAREKKLLRDIKKELFEWAKKEGFLDNNSFTFPANQIIDQKLKERE